MATELITITEYCRHHHTDVSFIDALEQNGLVEIVQVAQERCIQYDQLEQIESYTRWYHELEINVEGIETVHYLLQKIKDMQQHIHELESRLRRYGLDV